MFIPLPCQLDQLLLLIEPVLLQRHHLGTAFFYLLVQLVDLKFQWSQFLPLYKGKVWGKSGRGCWSCLQHLDIPKFAEDVP